MWEPNEPNSNEVLMPAILSPWFKLKTNVIDGLIFLSPASYFLPSLLPLCHLWFQATFSGTASLARKGCRLSGSSESALAVDFCILSPSQTTHLLRTSLNMAPELEGSELGASKTSEGRVLQKAGGEAGKAPLAVTHPANWVYIIAWT